MWGDRVCGGVQVSRVSVNRRGDVAKEVGERIARASRAFGTLKISIFRNLNISKKNQEGCV